MSYLVLARKYRPQTFDEVIGQEHITEILKNALLLNRVAHAYLFSGPRGTGKTTVARLLAKALNCKEGVTPKFCNRCENCIEITAGTSIDIIEIDGASNRGIDEIRQLKEQIKFSPIKSRYKVYIIDEVHMLTEAAFNALLKTLEEPPKFTVFILATTAPYKIPLTILSRCQRYQFHRIGFNDILKQLKYVVENENANVDEEVLPIIINASEGSLRDALSILDQIISSGKTTLNECYQLLGLLPNEVVVKFTQLIFERKIKELFNFLDKIIYEGYDINIIIKNLLLHLRNMMILKVSNDTKLLSLPKEHINLLREEVNKYSYDAILNTIDAIKKLEEDIKFATQPRIIFELAMIKLANMPLPEIEKEIEKDIPKGIEIEDIESVSKETITKETWYNILQKIKAKHIPTYGLLSNSEIVKVSEQKLVIEVETPFHKETLEKPENKKIIDSAILEVLSTPIEIQWKVRQKKIEKPSTEVEKKEIEVKSSIKEPIVSSALKILGGRVLQ